MQVSHDPKTSVHGRGEVRRPLEVRARQKSRNALAGQETVGKIRPASAPKGAGLFAVLVCLWLISFGFIPSLVSLARFGRRVLRQSQALQWFCWFCTDRSPCSLAALGAFVRNISSLKARACVANVGEDLHNNELSTIDSVDVLTTPGS